MKILQIITSLSTGGAEKLLIDSVPIYQRKSLDIDVISLSKNKTPFFKLLEKNSFCKVIGLTNGSLYNPILIFKIIPHLKKYDLIHIHLFPTLYWVVFAKIISFSNVKLIYTEHSTHNRRREKFIFKILDRFIYKRLDAIICITEGVKNNLEKHLKISEGIKVINNGININQFNDSISNNDFEFFSKEDFKLIQVSSFRKQKDQATVIKSLKLLPQKVKLLLVGDGVLIDENKRLVIQLNLQERVVFLGNRYDIPELIKYSDVAILSSENEGFGLAIVEGMASAKPVIASDIIGIKEIVEGYGLLFEKGNEKELAILIEKLMNNQLFYNKIAIQCYDRAKKYDVNKMIDLYISTFKIILSN